MAKIDPHTVDMLQLRAPKASKADKKAVKGLILSGEVFSEFSEADRAAIWHKLRSCEACDCVIPSIHTFFRDISYLNVCADAVKRLAVLNKQHPTVQKALAHSFRPRRANEDCQIQTSETTFRGQPGTSADRKETGYRQICMYAMRWYPEMAKDEQSHTLKAKPTRAKADENAIYDMAVLARRLGFRSKQIKNILKQSPDRQIARTALLKARRPDRYHYDDDMFESLVDRITEIFSLAIPSDNQPAAELIVGRAVKLKDRCGPPAIQAQRLDRLHLFLDRLHTEMPSQQHVSSFYVRQCVYYAFFGKPSVPRPHSTTTGRPSSELPSDRSSPLFVPDDSPRGDLESTAEEALARSDREGQPTSHHQLREIRRERRRQRREERQNRRQERRREHAVEQVPAVSRSFSLRDSPTSTMSDVSGTIIDNQESPRSSGVSEETELWPESGEIEQQAEEGSIPEQIEQEHLETESMEQEEQGQLMRENEESVEQERLAREAEERAEQERLAREAEERAEQVRRAREAEETAAAQRAEQERLAREAEERAEQERLAREAEEIAAAERLAAETAEQERLAKEAERMAAEEAATERGLNKNTRHQREKPLHRQLRQGTSHDEGVTAEDVEKLLDGMLQGNPEQKTIGSHDIQGRDLLVEGPSEATGNAHAEEERVAKERDNTLAQLQEKAEYNIMPSESHEILADPSRPVTQLDLSSLIARWREGASQLDEDDTRRPHSRRSRHGQQSRHSKPTGLRKSRMKERSTYQDINRTGTHDAATYKQLGWDPEASLPGPVPPTQAPPPPASVPVAHSTREGIIDVHPEDQTLHQPVREVQEPTLPAPIPEEHNDRTAADGNRVGGPLNQGAIHANTLEKPLEGTVAPRTMSSGIDGAGNHPSSVVMPYEGYAALEPAKRQELARQGHQGVATDVTETAEETLGLAQQEEQERPTVDRADPEQARKEVDERAAAEKALFEEDADLQ
ncbi:hypothetical protein MAP00_006153 [Monascus purpureus]|nr:hypothetical protein MAP00_006153 [Monascus purpureus]